MGWFNESLSDLETDELQARLQGLCHKVIARQYGSHTDMEQYEKLVTELYRRGVKPEVTLISDKEKTS